MHRQLSRHRGLRTHRPPLCFGPGTEIRFSEQLDFVVRDRQHGHEWSRLDIERRFSAGACDQVYLAIRLALAGYFSDPADPLPLILDDPLVTSDDRRFAAVMAYLAAAAQQRQIIVLTCHEGRHRRWLAETSDAAVTVLSLHQPAGRGVVVRIPDTATSHL